MKRKYYGLISMIIIAISFFLMLGYGFFRTKDMKSTVRISNPPPLPEIAIPGGKTANDLKALTNDLYHLANLSDDQTPFTLKIFGYEPVTRQNTKLTSSDIDSEFEEPEEFSYNLSLCFSSEKSSFCVIDNSLYTKDSVLPDNEKIIKIEYDRVLIEKSSVSKWIYLSREKEKNLPLKEKT